MHSMHYNFITSRSSFARCLASGAGSTTARTSSTEHTFGTQRARACPHVRVAARAAGETPSPGGRTERAGWTRGTRTSTSSTVRTCTTLRTWLPSMRGVPFRTGNTCRSLVPGTLPRITNYAPWCACRRMSTFPAGQMALEPHTDRKLRMEIRLRLLDMACTRHFQQ